MKKRLFYNPSAFSPGNTCTETDIVFLLVEPYTFTSGLTIQLSDGFTHFINLAGQSLTAIQISNILNNTPVINAYGLQFGYVTGPPGQFSIICYAQNPSIYVLRMLCDLTLGVPTIITGAAFPISSVVPNGLANFENGIRFMPLTAKNIYLFGGWTDVTQTSNYFMNEYWGEYVWTTEQLVPQMDPYAKQIIADLLQLHGDILLDGNTGIDLSVAPGATLTLWLKLQIINNNSLLLLENQTENDSGTHRAISN